MEYIIDKTFARNLKIMRLFGQYPAEDFTIWYKLRGFLLYFTFVYPVPCLGLLHIIIIDKFQMEIIAYSALVVSELILHITKLFRFYYKGEQAYKCIQFLQRPIFVKQIRNEKQEKIVEECISTCTRVNKIFFYFVQMSLGFWAIKPFFLQGVHLPLDLYFPFDIHSSKLLFCSIYIISLISVTYISTSSAVIDPLASGLAYQATCQLKILKDNLECLDEYADQDFNSVIEKNMTRDEIIYKKIGGCVDHHNAILEFCDLYQTVFSPVALSQAVASTFVICACCLVFTMIDPMENLMLFSTIGAFLITMTLEVYIYCYYGAILYFESCTLTDAIYIGKWYEFELKSQKALVLLMERAKKPIVITAGKLLKLNLDSFALLIKRSYSLLAVLKQY